MAVFYNDQFGGTEGTELATYNADWVKHSSYSGGTNMEISSGAIRNSAVSASSTCYYLTQSPKSADQVVTAELSKLTNYGTDNDVYEVGVAARIATGANTLYAGRWSEQATGTSWQLYKFVAGTATLLGSNNSTNLLSRGGTRVVALSVVGGSGSQSLALASDGTSVVTSTDDAITAQGQVGVRSRHAPDSGSAVSDTEGCHITWFKGENYRPAAELSLLGCGAM